MRKVHLDTDIGGDIDDLCALAMLLRWPDELILTGITTVAEVDGRRAGYVRRVLSMVGRTEVPVAAGADVSQGYYPYPLGLPPEKRYWPTSVSPSPNPVDQALDLLKSSIDQGATVVAIGPYTNLHLLERRFPGILRGATVVLMGGYLYPPRTGFPQWGNDMDFNVQVDVGSALTVFQRSSPILVPISATVETAVRRAHLQGLLRAGPLGRLLARQAEAFARDEQFAAKYVPTCPALPIDIIDFLHDPLACAVALDWRDGIVIEELPVSVEVAGGALFERRDTSGGSIRLVTRVDGDRFSQFWYDIVCGTA